MKVPKSLLVLSDALEDIQSTLDELTAQGTEVRNVVGAYQFVAAFASAPADVVILDLEGFRERELELPAILREIHPNVGVVVLANQDQREFAGRALCAGADLYLMKPVAGPELLEAVDRATLRQHVASAEPSGGLRAEVLSSLALGIAHEINNPLATVSGWLQMLEADRTDDEKLVELLRSMRGDADRIATVVRELQVFAQQGPPRRDDVDMAQIIAELERLYAVRCKTKGIELSADVAPDLPAVAGDEAQLRRACEVILAQSESALDSGGRIRIACRAEDQGVSIVFQDNGPLIPAKAIARIFDPFHDVRNGHTSGLGLCLSDSVVRSHGGRIDVKSEESCGNQFSVWLPARE